MSLTYESIKPLLNLLERVNPCGQDYYITDEVILISYRFKLNIFNFTKFLPIYINTRIIGLPISLCEKGYWGHSSKVKLIIHSIKGLKIVLNAEGDLGTSGQTLSTFVFYNRFEDFNDYLNSLRSPYRRRIKKALNLSEKLKIESIDKKDFTNEHYDLYINVMERTKDPLETLSIEFFTHYDSEIYEFKDRDSNLLLGFIQLKEIDDILYFFFGGFKREFNEEYDLYYNMLIQILKIGMERNIKTINFGQTAEESKLKIGCVEEKRYLYIHHSNKLINNILQILAPKFSYKPYNTIHHVFKKDKEIDL